MINRLTYYLFVFVAVLAAACSHIDEMESPVPDQNLVMRFDMGCDTKVSNDDITSQEFIVYDYIYGASSEGYPDGTCYIDGSKVTLKYRDGSWGFYHNNSDTRVDFLWTKTGTHEFFAYNKVDYYSYNSQVDYWKVNFTFDDQNKCLTTDKAIKMLYFDGKYEDLIYAKTTRDVESEDGYAPVEIHFNHMFASVKVTFRNNSLTKKTISDISLTSLYCSTGAQSKLYFDVSQSPTLDLDDVDSYEFKVSQEVPDGTEWDAFGTVIVLPQELGGMTEEVVWHEGGVEKRLRIYNDLGTSYWYAGKLYHYVITLEPTELDLEPTATIEHIEDAGGNKSSVVNVNLNAPVEELPRITDLVITVTGPDPESNVIKTYEAATVDSNEIRLECGELLPPGTYNVSGEYHDGVYSRSFSTDAVSEATAVQPAVGYYVNSDGTFSETFISSSSNASGYSIAKIFYMDDISSDTQLAVYYSHCTRGLAYEVDPSTGLFKLNKHEYIYGRDVYESWGYGNCPMINWDTKDGYLYTYSNFHGFTNTVAIREYTTQGFMSAVDTSIPVVNGVTSSWYIPSVYEVKLIGKDTISAVDDTWDSYIWTSSISKLSANNSYACYYNFNTDEAEQLSDINDYNHRSYCRILAF